MTNYLKRQEIPDLRSTCASCGRRIDEDEPIYAGVDPASESGASTVLAHVRCPHPDAPHAFERATHVGQLLLGMNPPSPAGVATWICRCGMAFVAPTDRAAKHELGLHLRGGRP